MRMRFATCAMLVGVLVAAGASASDAAASRRSACPGRGVRIITRTTAAELVVLPERAVPHHEPVGERIAGCAYARGRTVVLGEPASGSAAASGGLRAEVLAGTMTAFEEGKTTGYQGEEGLEIGRIRVVNLLTGQTVHRVPDGRAPETKFHVGAPGHVESILLKPDGAAAWTVATSPEYGTFQLLSVDASGERLLAQGPQIGPRSLAVAEDTLYWTNAGAAFLAPLQ